MTIYGLVSANDLHSWYNYIAINVIAYLLYE